MTFELPFSLASGIMKLAVLVSFWTSRDSNATWVKPFEAKRAAVAVPINGPAATTTMTLFGDGAISEMGFN